MMIIDTKLFRLKKKAVSDEVLIPLVFFKYLSGYNIRTWQVLIFETYAYFAKYNQETEDIHYLSGLSKVESMSDSGYSTKHIELKSNRTTKSYELFFIGQFDHFPCGAHLISDGSEIFFRAWG